MDKTFEKFVMATITAGLALATAIINSELPTATQGDQDMDPSDVKAYVKGKYKAAARGEIDDEYREDVFVGIFNRCSTYIEQNAAPEDHADLWAYNEKLYNRYI